MSWAVELYLEEDGSSPVEDFLNSIGARSRAKIVQVVKRLELDGPTLPFPYSSQVEGRLRELRTQLGKEKLRILYYADVHRSFVLLHAMRKQADKIPERDKEIARGRMMVDMQRKSH